MSSGQNQEGGQPAPALASTTPDPAPQPDFVDGFTNSTMIGTDKRSDTNPAPNRAVPPRGNIERR
ncbi:hypothetical protein ACFW96_38610 [Streptomyces gardneri]|uniref:hypothetical protein n=1 Tax=Streptomyces gardneri TaxID=66892 RepID=UPI00368E9DD4